ncbi:MAG TPA: hypothetical protein VFB04_12985 [Terriglobales bacterium]|nr:hypothetical protein [Terriglobales bacterium]
MSRQLNAVLVLMMSSSSPFWAAAVFVASGAWQKVSKEFYGMKKSMFCALLAVAMACGATALYAQQDNMSQGAPGTEHRMAMSPDQRLEHMSKTLNLTADQQQKIKPLLENEQTQMQSLHQDSSMSRDDRRSKAQQIRQSTDQQISGILTPEQQQKWQQMQERQRERMGRGGAGQGAPQQAPPQ